MSAWDPGSDYTSVNTEQIGLPKRVDKLEEQYGSLSDIVQGVVGLLHRVERLEALLAEFSRLANDRRYSDEFIGQVVRHHLEER